VRVLVTGAGGQLGRDLVDFLSGNVPAGGRAPASSAPPARRLGPALEVVAADHRRLDVSDRHAVGAALEGLRPDIVYHCAAWTAVDACEGDPERAFAVNAAGTRHVAEAARRHGAHLVYVSTDYVFDGRAERAYVEWDRPNPQSVYGRSKLGGELELGPDDSVVRTSWVCGYHGTNMVRTALRLMARPGPLRFVDDQLGSPTFTADLAGALATVGLERLPGVFHLTNDGVTSWYGFVRAVVEAGGGDPNRVVPITTAELDPPRPAPRPANSALDNLAWRCLGNDPLPPWQDGLGRLVPALGHGAGPT
jgi:dTDP-4-dehydrorhamnose reductase